MQGHRSRHGDYVGLVVHVAGRLVGLADTDKAIKGIIHVVGEGGFVDLELVAGVGHRQLTARHGNHAAAATEATPAAFAVFVHTGCYGHRIVLIVHAAGRLVALADTDKPVEGVTHVVGLEHGAAGSPPICVTAVAVFSVVGGILVGSAGLILTFAMCKAMNRSLGNVIFGAFGGDAVQSTGAAKTAGTVRKTTASDAAVLMNYASNVVIVPGYGLAVAQAQHVIHELEEMLTKKGVNVVYAIHPVAGRMPGHMNVLLAESNVSYDKLVEMDDINPRFPQTDVVFVVGANDVVNPAAHNDPSSPIYGMPILDVENAKQIIINKRSMNPGYAGIENELFYNQKASMLFGDAKSAIQSLINELKNM